MTESDVIELLLQEVEYWQSAHQNMVAELRGLQGYLGMSGVMDIVYKNSGGMVPSPLERRGTLVRAGRLIAEEFHLIDPPSIGVPVVTLCCGKMPAELGRGDRLTWIDNLVTCKEKTND
ncbi:hypothetical protein SEA_A3WALLY_48 [Microbacterium phage A3Wally]|nr:hypothetical protein SEA_A3WALLY_48 [Microbacterium phage A3Wally]